MDWLYCFADDWQLEGVKSIGDSQELPQPVGDAETALANLYYRTSREVDISSNEFREALRRGAALLRTSKQIQLSVIHYLVGIPFQIFSKESIKFGIYLWLGVIHENPKAEPRILVEVADAWEKTIQQRKGLFDPSLK